MVYKYFLFFLIVGYDDVADAVMAKLRAERNMKVQVKRSIRLQGFQGTSIV